MTETAKTTKLLNSPLVELEQEFEAMTPDQVWETEQHMDGIAVRAVRISSYLAARRRGQNHDKAVNHQNRRAEAIRKTIGFLRPRDDVRF